MLVPLLSLSNNRNPPNMRRPSPRLRRWRALQRRKTRIFRRAPRLAGRLCAILPRRFVLELIEQLHNKTRSLSRRARHNGIGAADDFWMRTLRREVRPPPAGYGREEDTTTCEVITFARTDITEAFHMPSAAPPAGHATKLRILVDERQRSPLLGNEHRMVLSRKHAPEWAREGELAD